MPRMDATAQPVCHVVAGPNGSGKSTFARNGAEVVCNPERTAQMRGEVEVAGGGTVADGFLMRSWRDPHGDVGDWLKKEIRE